MSDHPHETIQWLGLKLEVPGDWSIARHGVDAERGVLVLVDRLAERLALSWRTLDAIPEVAQVVAAERAEDIAKLPECLTADVRISGWHGYRRTVAGESTIRAARYDPCSRRLIQAELSVEPKLGRTTRVTEQLLNGIRCVPGSEPRRLRAFGVDVTLPPNLELHHTTIQPASVTFEFVNAAHMAEQSGGTAVLHRMAMADAWYRGNCLDVIERESPGIALHKTQVLRVNGHAAGYAEGDASGTRFARWIGRGRTRRATVWHCPSEDAVYYLATTSPDRNPMHPNLFLVTCCKGLYG